MNNEFNILTICSYLLGSVPVSYLVGKWYRGIDIRQYGSGHVGAGNLRYSASMKVAVPVALFDFFKGVIMVAIAQQVFHLELYQQGIVGIAVIAGHNWPVFLRFNGGRGLAASMGASFVLFQPQPWGVVIFAALAAFSLLRKGTALPVLAGIAALPLGCWLLHGPMEITLALLLIFLVMVLRRLTAPKTPLSDSVKTPERLLYRFLFDRDIRDGAAWIYRKPSKPSPAGTQTPSEKDHEKV